MGRWDESKGKKEGKGKGGGKEKGKGGRGGGGGRGEKKAYLSELVDSVKEMGGIGRCHHRRRVKGVKFLGKMVFPLVLS